MNREILLIFLLIFGVGLFFIWIYAEYSRYKIIGEYRKKKTRLEYESWRLDMIAKGFPAPDTWEVSEKKLEAQK